MDRIEPMTEINFSLSRKLAREIKAKQSECWANAWRAWKKLPDALYVEGWVNYEGVPIEHGWLEYEGKIVDPTLTDDRERLYFPGVRWEKEEAARVWATSSKTMERYQLPLVWRQGWGGFENKDYYNAQQSCFWYGVPDYAREWLTSKSQNSPQGLNGNLDHLTLEGKGL